MGRIAVLGGGIAGSAACLKLAQCGIRPKWIARSATPGDKPGESLSASARTVLADLSAAELLEAPVHRAANSVFSAWGADTLNERSGIVHLEGPGLVLDRPRFEGALCERARDATDFIAAEVTACAPDGNGWTITHGNGTTCAEICIDATGRRAILARDQVQRFRADQLVALVAFLSQDPASDVAPTPATLIETVPGGWWYATLLADGRLALNFYTDADLTPADVRRDPSVFRDLVSATTFVSRWITEAGFVLDHLPSLASAATTWLSPCAGENWLAAGDAAAAFDPLSSHGMTTALWTGAQAATAAIAATKGDMTPARSYAEAVAKGIHDFVETRATIYAQEKRFAGAPFWQRRT